jgi:hypothetical protein
MVEFITHDDTPLEDARIIRSEDVLIVHEKCPTNETKEQSDDGLLEDAGRLPSSPDGATG